MTGLYWTFPDPHNEAIAKLYSLEFYTMLSRRMSQSGALVSPKFHPPFLPEKLSGP